MNSLGIRREELGTLIGSEQLAREMIADGWIKPVLSERNIVLFDRADVIKAFARLHKERPTKRRYVPKKKSNTTQEAGK